MTEFYKSSHFGLLFIVCSVFAGAISAYAQTTILSGSTINASDITAGNTIVIEQNGTLTMDISSSFTSITTSAIGVGTATINGANTLTITGAINVVNATTLTTAASVVIGAGSLTINGTFVNGSTGALTVTTSTVNGTYTHNKDGGTIPTATWAPTSNCNITGVSSTAPTGFNQPFPGFGNLTWNCPSQAGNVYLQSNISIQGDFSVLSTGALPVNPGARALRMSDTVDSYVINVSGNLTVDNSTFKMNNSSGSCFVNVGGSFTLNSTLGQGSNFTISTGPASSTLFVDGDVNILGGTSTLLMQEDNNIGAVGILDVKGNLSITAGSTITENDANGNGLIIFSGVGTQTFTEWGVGSITAVINIAVNSGSTLQMATDATVVGGGGAFLLSPGATLGIRSPVGITTAGAGNIQTATRTYSAGAHYIYNGSANQAVGNGLTINTPANVIISNPGNTVTFGVGTSLSGNLTITAGTLATNNFSLSLAAGRALTVSAGTTIDAGTTSILWGGAGGAANIDGVFRTANTVGFSGAAGTAISSTNSPVITLGGSSTVQYTVPTGGQSITGRAYDNVILDNTSGTNTAGGNITINNLIATSGGTLNMGSNSLVVTSFLNTGAIVRFSGAANGIAVSTGTVEYYGATQTVGAGTYNNLIINQSGGDAVLSGTTTINSTLTLSAGNTNIGANNLILRPAATIAGASATTMIIASGGGEVRKEFSATGLFIFPIGDNTGTTEYSPVTVDVTSAGGFSSAYVGVSVVDAKHPNNQSATNFLSRYWNVTQSGITNCVATISGVYLDADINGTETAISGAQLNGTFNQSTNPWSKYTAVNDATNTFVCTGVTPNLTAGQTSAFTGITLASPTVNISADASICNGSSTPLSSLGIGDPVFSYSWSPALGLSSTIIANPVASPTVTTMYTVTATDGNGVTATNNTTITVDQLPTTSAAGADQFTCNSGVFTLAGNSPGVGSGVWSIVGPPNGAVITTPGAFNSGVTGLTSGSSVTLRWSITNGVCAASEDDVVLTNTLAPIVSAGSDSEVCQGVNYNFSTQTTLASASNQSSLLWIHFGTGTLFNATTLTPTYQPGVGETGNVTFTLTANGSGSCVSVNDLMTLIITPSATANAGSDAETCEGVTYNFSTQMTLASASNFLSILWTTPGAGILTNANTLTPTYAPGAGETGNVPFTLTATGNGSCVSVNDQMMVTITPLAIVNAGSDEEICQGGIFTFSTQATTASALNYSSLVWTHNGAGSIFNSNTLTPTYFASAGETGIVTFTLTAFGNGSCAFQTSTMDLMITSAPVSSAGSNDAVCEGTAMFDFTTRSTIASSANGTIAWTHNGMGSLNSGALLNPIYTVGAGDVNTTITFTLTVTSPSAVCSPVIDQFTLQVNRAALASVPSTSYSVCEPQRVNLSGFIGGSATSGAWSLLTGGGTLSTSSLTGLNVTAFYDTITADVNTTLQFRLTTNDPDGAGPCPVAFVDMDVIVDESAKVDAGPDFAICEYEDITLNGSISGSTASVTWSGGSGPAQYGNVNNPITSYDLTAAERLATNLMITFTLTTNDPPGVCPSVSDQVIAMVNDTLSFVTITMLNSAYAENSPPVVMVGVPAGGVFAGPGVSGNTFFPSIANISPAINTITYTYADPATGCFSIPGRLVIVNPVTTVDFSVATQTINGLGDIQVCANQGDVELLESPALNIPILIPPQAAVFSSPDIPGNIIFDGTNYYLRTDGLAAGTYQILYEYTDNLSVTSPKLRFITIASSPQAIIDVNNSCVISSINFLESSVIVGTNPAGATLSAWQWNFGNGIGSSLQEPSYQYPLSGNYNVALTVTTSEGCFHQATKLIQVGPVPKMNFAWSEFCNGDNTEFTDNTDPGISTIIQYTWEFNDGFVVTGPAGGTIPGGTNGGRTSGMYDSPFHRYDLFGQKDVKLTVTTNDGCTNDTTRRVSILAYGTPSPTAGYIEDFELGQGSWFETIADQGILPIVSDTSWVFGLPSGSVINSASSGINAWWTGRNPNSATTKSTYYNNEKSAVIGPCFNLLNIKRPMLSIDYWADSEDRFDGVVVQYSINGGVDWETIGDDGGRGIDWYNGRALTGNPGSQAIGQFGWTDRQSGWKTARYNLDQIPKIERDEIIFRVAFGSNNDNGTPPLVNGIPNQPFNGFAFDNILVGEKQRNVLVEYFTNAGISPTSNDYLNNLYSDQFLTPLFKDSSDFFKIQYHIANPSTDLINQDNPVDPATRSLFYGVSQPPVGIMDGILGNYFGKVFNGDQTKIDAIEVDRRALEDPLFSIVVSDLPTTSDSVKLDVQFEYIAAQPFTTPVTFHVGLVETNLAGNINVLRKMLLGSEGTTVATPWTFGTIMNIPVSSVIDIPIGIGNNNLWIVAFVQDRNTKRIHQAVLVKAPSKNESTVVGIEEDPILARAREIQIFPNPASQHLNFSSEYRLKSGYAYSIVDQRGITLMSGELQEDLFTPQQVELNNLANGIYFVIISRGDRSLVHRKIAVMNRN